LNLSPNGIVSHTNYSTGHYKPPKFGLISTAVALREGMKIEIQVHLTGKRAFAEVIRADPEQPLHCGIALVRPENIWGISLPPDDWYEANSENSLS